MGITTRVALSCAYISAAVRDVCARARGVRACPSDGVGLPSRRSDVGGLMSARGSGCLFWLVRWSRGVLSSSLLSLVCPRWPCGGVCGLVSCFFVAVGSFFCSCQKVAYGLNFGLVCRVGVSLWRSEGVALPYFGACAWGRIYPNPPTLNFPHGVHAVSI